MLRTTTGKKPLLAGLQGCGGGEGGGGGVVGERDPRSKGKNVLEQEREPQQSSTNILYGVASGIWTQATIAPQYFTAWQFINLLSTTNLTVSACKTAIDLYPPPRLPLGIPEKNGNPTRFLFFLCPASLRHKEISGEGRGYCSLLIEPLLIKCVKWLGRGKGHSEGREKSLKTKGVKILLRCFSAICVSP